MKDLITQLGFTPKEGFSNIVCKQYSKHKDFCIEVDFSSKKILYGNQITCENKSTQNFAQPENWVVLECVDRLLEKGYKPTDITLEKTWLLGHKEKGRLDILVKKEGKAFLMIECKTWGKEFDKALTKTHKDGGQLFSYFWQYKSAEYLVLYASKFSSGNINYRNEIVKIEEDYLDNSNEKEDVFDRWSKVTYQNGIFDEWISPYNFKNKSLTKKDLKPLTEEDSHKLFHEFLAILRKHSISDKSNAFNKIFNLFLAKIFDEQKRPNDKLHFQWWEGIDDPVKFQIRLINLYKAGMYEFLKKEIEGISDSDFGEIPKKELQEKKKKWLKFNKIFDIKDVMDNESFDDNQKVLKEVVDLLHQYQVRYPRKQKHLSDFFELLLTTGLKQESGQFFTPPPVARFIIRSLPVKTKVQESLAREIPKLPAMIDYAAGSGHFITEMMEEIQSILDEDIDTTNFFPSAIDDLEVWRRKKYDWAKNYIYAVEKDDRLVKVAKVGCYFYGDGLAQVIEGDGLDSFQYSTRYRGLLKDNQTKPRFDFVLSNPPYSVKSFKRATKNKNFQNDFDLFHSLTDQSSEIEALFIERTKQLLKKDGIAAIILPSSILSNGGIYTKARKILLQHFEFIGITKLGSGTFMATGTNTVILFLRRRSDDVYKNIETRVDTFCTNFQDVTVEGREQIFSKYITHTWEGITFDDYCTLLQKSPNEAITSHEIFKEYQKTKKSNITNNNEEKLYNDIIEIEKEKILYFILAFGQKLVLVDTGDKKAEKQFLGYEFSERKGHEGIHPIQRGKTIDECTSLFDPNSYDNPDKASTYILQAFEGNFSAEIPTDLHKNIRRTDLVDMLTFDRGDFEGAISLSVKKKIQIESQFQQIALGEIMKVKNGFAFKSREYVDYGIRILRIKNVQKGYIHDDDPVFIDNSRKNEFKNYILKKGDILISMTGNPGRAGMLEERQLPAVLNQRVGKADIISPKILKEFLFILLNTDYFEESAVFLSKGLAQLNISASQIESIKIPLPPKDIQQKIVDEIGVLEKREGEMKEEIEKMKGEIFELIDRISHKGKVSDLCKISANKINPQDNKEEKFLYLGLENIESNTGKFLTKPIVRGQEIQSIKNVFQEGDILYGKLRPYLNKVCLSDSKGICSTDILVLKTESPIFLKYALLSKNCVDETSKLMEGISLPRIKSQEFLNLNIPLPPLSKQKQITSNIEKIEINIEKLQKELSQIPQKKEDILKKYL